MMQSNELSPPCPALSVAAPTERSETNNPNSSRAFFFAGAVSAASPVSPQPGAHLWSHRRPVYLRMGSKPGGGGRGMTCRNY
jgi:hypothetical protein